MMINNNPYNLPERPPHNKNRIYTEANQHRQDPTQVLTPYSQYLAKQSHHPNTITKNTLNVEDNPVYRQPYQGMRNEIKHFLPSPKNGSSNPTNLNNFIPSSAGNRANINIGSSLQKKQTGSLRQSFGVAGFDTSINPAPSLKQLHQKIEALSITIKSNEKRITQLQKANSNPSTSPMPKSPDPETSTIDISNSLTRIQNDWVQKFHSIQSEMQGIRDQLRNKNNFKVSSELDRIVVEKCRELLEGSKFTAESSTISGFKNNPEELKREVEGLKLYLEEKIKKNFQFLTSVIGRLQRQFHSSLVQIQPNFKPSAIKCSTSAILLRFVQCFKVRKHSSKSGQVKITVADNTYYIDGEGYLLDKEQFYIVDSRDCRVRLEDKHIKLLKQQSILQ